MAELELQTTKAVTNPLEIEVGLPLSVQSTTSASIDTVQQESVIEGYKKEYSIVGDGLYASVSMDQAPQWLVGMIDGVIDAQLESGLFDLRQANQAIQNAMDGIDVAKNQYDELINIQATIEGVIASRLTTLNTAVEANSASIISLDASKVTPDQAMAIANDRVAAELNSGGIKAQLDRIDLAVADTNKSFAASTTIMEARFEGVSDAVSTLEDSVEANAEQAMANFAYNANLTLNGTTYTSGFGLATSLINPSIPVGSSEFWVQSDNIRFVDTSHNMVLRGDSQGLTFPGSGSIKSAGYDLDSNTGVFMGWNPASADYELMAGNGSQYLRWNGSNLTVKGDIIADSISVPVGSIKSADIGVAEIGSANITDLAVTSAKIDNLAVTEAKIADLSVDTLKIKDQAVTVPISGGTSVTIPSSLHNLPVVIIVTAYVYVSGGTPTFFVNIGAAAAKTSEYGIGYHDFTFAMTTSLPSGTVIFLGAVSGTASIIQSNVTVLGVKK